MFLVDTNIFLEILLAQDKSKACKKFFEENCSNKGEISSNELRAKHGCQRSFAATSPITPITATKGEKNEPNS